MKVKDVVILRPTPYVTGVTLNVGPVPELIPTAYVAWQNAATRFESRYHCRE
jgi:hypothetical protein